MANVPQVIKISSSGVMEHGAFYASLGLSPALPRVPAWIPLLMNCQLAEQG